MPKGSFWNDTFEKMAEMGQSTAKKTVKSVAQTFNPLQVFEKSDDGTKDQSEMMRKAQEKRGPGVDHTPLDFNKLQNGYGSQDEQKADALRNRLFQLVKSGEKQAIQERKQTEGEKKQNEEHEQKMKKQKKIEAQRQSQSSDMPHGKERKSIFSAKKVAKREQTEVKPASGKQ